MQLSYILFFSRDIFFDNQQSIVEGNSCFLKAKKTTQQLSKFASKSKEFLSASIVLEARIKLFCERFNFAPRANKY